MRFVPTNPIDNKERLDQLMFGTKQATSHYFEQRLPSYKPPYYDHLSQRRSGWGQIKHQSSALLALDDGNQVISWFPSQRPVMRKVFLCHNVTGVHCANLHYLATNNCQLSTRRRACHRSKIILVINSQTHCILQDINTKNTAAFGGAIASCRTF